MTKCALIAALLGVLGLSGTLVAVMTANGTLRAENEALRLSLDGCKARLDNIQKDKESDDAINNIPDTDLRNVPDGWLLPPGSGGIY